MTTTNNQAAILRTADEAVEYLRSMMRSIRGLDRFHDVAAYAQRAIDLTDTIAERAAIQHAGELTKDQTRQIYAEWQHAQETPHGLYKRFQAAAPAAPVQASPVEPNSFCEECQGFGELRGETCPHCCPRAAPEVKASELPKWIDAMKGKDPTMDDVIAYIETLLAARSPVAAPQPDVSARNRALEEAALVVWSDQPDAGVLRGAAHTIRALKSRAAPESAEPSTGSGEL